MTVLLCNGARGGPWGHPASTIQFGIDGKEVGAVVDLSQVSRAYIYQTCLAVATNVPIPRVDQIFGFRMTVQKSFSIIVQTMALVGDL